ncbi:LANO_0B02916g1_1 [Lachancea nothofagi CBS 11611]|uniref:Enhancer of polycomb-like protein n=1 Tax=Lachancea nothofagi CBS 11611 TaxID=1266666 RepID=A0A1G4IWC5_9SACH|nr:LANO_0B02916g1_1 [Lachancea nothofagi CBS 11611]
MASNNATSAVPSGSAADAANTRFRHRKISVRQRLQVFKAADLRKLDKDELQQRELVEIETGVDKNEEKEEHLHQILQKNQLARKELYIPTPDASRTWPEYTQFYQGKFVEPQSYIRFSATVEDCCGSRYNMDESDEQFLASSALSAETGGPGGLSEDEFELLCSSFETAIHERQPFLSIDPENILSLEEIKPTILKRDLGDAGIKHRLAQEIGLRSPQTFITQFDTASSQNTRPLATLVEKFGDRVYAHWKARKVESHGGEISPQLKFERHGGDRDDNDPYVCFRRREVRQARKTRRIDYQNSHKLRLLHQQLQYTKKLALLVAKREKLSLDSLNNDIRIFELRRDIKPVKQSLGIKGEDDSLLVDARRRKLVSNVVMHSPQETNAKKIRTKLKKSHTDSASSKHPTSKGNKQSHAQSQQAQQQLAQQQLQQQQLQLAQQQQQLAQQQAQQLAQQQKQQGSSVSAHVYVKLPSSKIPDILLEDVDNILLTKEKSARNYVEERMRKRKLEDGDTFFNLTDDPYNPVFDISVPADISATDAPFSSIASSKFEAQRSYYVPRLEDYLDGNSDDVAVFSKDGDRIDNPKYRKIEHYNPFQEHGEVYTRELPFKIRRRMGRLGLEFIDIQRPRQSFTPLSELIDLSEVERQEQSNEVIDVYDSKLDELTRLHGRWKHNSEYNNYGAKFSEEPARLNQISNETQTIRFGTMLGTKSYEQLRDATFKHRQEIYNQRRVQKTSVSQKLPKINGSSPTSSNGMSSTPARTPSTSSLKKNASAKQQHLTSVN